MDSPEVTFTLAYLVFAVCFVFTPTEFHSAGLTVQNLLSGWLGSEDAAFVPYHLRRTSATLLCHSLLPLGEQAGPSPWRALLGGRKRPLGLAAEFRGPGGGWAPGASQTCGAESGERGPAATLSRGCGPSACASRVRCSRERRGRCWRQLSACRWKKRGLRMLGGGHGGDASPSWGRS